MLLKNKYLSRPDVTLEFVTTNKVIIVFPKLYEELNEYKNKIDDNIEWDKMKKIGNPNELIHISYNKDFYNNSIAKYTPLSRSYFKMQELIYDYNLLLQNKNISIGCLAEGPGGFMEAIYNYRHNKNRNDCIYGITLASTNKHIPGWKKMLENMSLNDKGIEINYGNLYNINDIKLFIANFKKQKAYLVTADGGFDYSVDFNNQEQLSHRIIFCEIVTAVSIQEVGGHFICKIFDIFTLLSLKMIYLLYCLYDEVYITKPQTSRLANSEKYIVAKGFKGIENDMLENLHKLVQDWKGISGVIYDFTNFELDNGYIYDIYQYNCTYVNNQITYIKKTIDLIKNKPEKDRYLKIIKQQVNNAIAWCQKYDMEINYNSKYMKY